MKKAIFFSAIFLTAMTGCGRKKQAGNDEFITVVVTKSYSTKKELILQDFMDVEYIVLETNDEFVNQGFVQDIGKEIILVKNRIADGNIYVYDRSGKALRKINRKGQGPEEYIRCDQLVLDEDNEEIFVGDAMTRKIFVYDLYGNFKRSFNQKVAEWKEDITRGYPYADTRAFPYTSIFNYDKDNLICFDAFHEEIAFVLISKEDGRITTEMKTPFKERKHLFQAPANDPLGGISPAGGSGSLIPYDGHWILAEFSSDTVYTFLQDYSLHPAIVKTPSIQSMEPGVFFHLRFLTDRYYFMETIINEYDFNSRSGFPRTFFMYDRQEKAFSGYTVYNGDYSTKQEVHMYLFRRSTHEIAWYFFESYQLVESYKKGELKGKLKEIAAKLDKEDNRVIMLVKHKK